MAEADKALRAEIAASGQLHDGYNPKLAALHTAHAQRLAGILDEYGWPARSLVGTDEQQAAFLVAQHAISHPDLMRRCLRLIRSLPPDEVDQPWAARLEDRIRFMEGRPQVFGTQHWWDETGSLSPAPIDRPQELPARRASAGLPPLAEETAELRARTAEEAGVSPPDVTEWRRRMDDWARSVGWRP